MSDQPPSSSSPEPAKGPTSAPAGWTPSYVFLAIVTLVNLVADIGTKQWIKRLFETDPVFRAARKIEVVKGSVNLIYATNKGGAWGILQGEQEWLRRPFFLVVSVAAIVFIISLYRRLTPGQRALKWGLPLVLGGALGNLIDRIIYGWVIDFIDCYAKKGTLVYRVLAKISSGGSDEMHWPTFNVADIAICVGVGLMAIDMFTSREKEKKKEPAAEAPKSTPATSSDAPPA
jgi:signal peptidase II